MNCPSRTDDTRLHEDWNQSPRVFSPDLTTRQDLNGIANIREQKAGEMSPGLLTGSSNWKGIPPIEEKIAGDPRGAGRGAFLTTSGMDSSFFCGGLCNRLLTSNQDASLPKILTTDLTTKGRVRITMFSRRIRKSRIGLYGFYPCCSFQQLSHLIV